LAADRSWTLATGAGVVVAVVAGLAGNRATASETADGARFPAAYPGVIGVAATDAKDVVTEDSIHGEHVSLAAPGYSVVTAFRDWGDCVYGTQGQSSSFATGYVSAAAHCCASGPQPSAAQIRVLPAHPRGPSGIRRDDKAGWGLIQPYEPMTLAYDISVGGVHRPRCDRRCSPPRSGDRWSSARVAAVPPTLGGGVGGLGVRACCRRCADGPRSRCWPLTGRSPAWPTGSC
jgi:membrane-anchored mycosin MYCP